MKDRIVSSTAKFSAEKLELLAYLLEEENSQRDQTQRICPRGNPGNPPLSFTQQRLWFLDQFEPNNAAYNIPVAYRLTGVLNVRALEQSLHEIVRRHEVLRTTFWVENGQPVQVITTNATFKLSVVDLSTQPSAHREAEIIRLMTKEAQTLFDLAQGPLFRASLLQAGREHNILLLTMHHIISDGWSISLLLQELSPLYNAFCVGKISPLSEMSIQYADFAVWQRQRFQEKGLDESLAFWKKQLQNAPSVLQLPTDYPRPALQTFRGARQPIQLSKTLVNAIRVLSRQEDCTLFMTLLAAFKVLLYRYTGQNNIVVGSPVANRNQSQIEGLIGFFVNTLPLRTDLSGNPTFRQLLACVRETALDAYAHQDLPFEKLVEELQPERSLSHGTLFQTMFILQNTPTESLELSGLTARRLKVDNKTAKFDLTLSMTEKDDQLSGVIEYNTNLFEASTIKRMAGHFQTLLEGIIANPDVSISQLPLLTETERHQILVEWNNTSTDYPQGQCIHQLFEAQVERTPDAVAVVFEEEQLT